MPDDAVAAILGDAADIIERDGWVQRRNGHADIGWCAMGAIGQACRPGGPILPALEEFRRHLGTISISTWNDRPGRTKGEVVAALRSAASGRPI